VVGALEPATGDRRHRHRRSVIQHSQAHWRTSANGSTGRARYRSSTPPIDSATAPTLDCSAESATTDGHSGSGPDRLWHSAIRRPVPELRKPPGSDCATSWAGSGRDGRRRRGPGLRCVQHPPACHPRLPPSREALLSLTSPPSSIRRPPPRPRSCSGCYPYSDMCHNDPAVDGGTEHARRLSTARRTNRSHSMTVLRIYY
jgi:hypothetical protein